MHPTLAGEARLRDPAHRDQDGVAWRRGRFAERVRRQWNAVELPAGASPDDDLDAMAQAIQARIGGAAEPIRERLAEFVRLDAVAGPPGADPLVRPGAAD
ncbi:MAG: hypothetical protein ACYC2H_08260 [Thermoplasmatota archaeon]